MIMFSRPCSQTLNVKGSVSVGHSVSRSVLSVCVCVCLSTRFLSNCGCGGYQTWICGYVQRALSTASLERRCQQKRVHELCHDLVAFQF